MSKSKAATPDPMVSMRYLREVWEAVPVKWTPALAVVSTKVPGWAAGVGAAGVWCGLGCRLGQQREGEGDEEEGGSEHLPGWWSALR